MNPCNYYFNIVAKKCHELFKQDASQLRQTTAEMCNDYKPRGE